jgi:Fic family protein
MAAKKTRKPSKKPHPKAAKPKAKAARSKPKAAKPKAKATKPGRKTPRMVATSAKTRTKSPPRAKVRKVAGKPAPKRPAAKPKPVRQGKLAQLASTRRGKIKAARALEKKHKKQKKVLPPPPPVREKPRPVKAAPPTNGRRAPASTPPPERRSSPSAQRASQPRASQPRASQSGSRPGPSSVPKATSSRPGSRPSKAPPVRTPSRPPLREAPPRLVALPLPILAPPKRPSIEERAGQLDGRLMAQSEDFRKRYEESLDMSWIYHDSALEGVVYTFDELRAALSAPAGHVAPAPDSNLQPTYADIRRHKEAIEFVRDYGLRKKLPVTIDIVKRIYLILHPEEGDIKTVKYRKDIPQHRLYFHEYAPPDKIGYKVRQIVDWLNDPETRKTRNGIRIAARAHYDLLRVYPFPTDSGKVSRLFMNLLLMRTGLPPAIIHSTERQRYYEALKGSATTVLQMVQEAVENALSSVEKLLDEHETRKRAFVS